MYAHTLENAPIHLHTFKLKFRRSVFSLGVLLPLSFFLLCRDGTLYVFRLFKFVCLGADVGLMVFLRPAVPLP